MPFLADEALRSGQLVRLLSEYEDESDVGVYAVFPSNRYLLPKVRCFVEFLIELISGSSQRIKGNALDTDQRS
jgi:DNA-binding transcriptional LysR family regulator